AAAGRPRRELALGLSARKVYRPIGISLWTVGCRSALLAGLASTQAVLKNAVFRSRDNMSTISHDRVLLPGDTPERGPVLLWMIFTGLSVFAGILLWHYGFIRLMVVSDRTYISSLIAALYVITCGHCFWRTRAIAREAEAARRCREILAGPDGA